MSIKRVVWVPGDEVIISAGTDGNVYGWPISRENRIDIISANNRSSAILGLAVDCPNLLFPKVTILLCTMSILTFISHSVQLNLAKSFF